MKICRFFWFLTVLGFVWDSGAAAAVHEAKAKGEKYSFSKLLNKEFLKGDGQEELQARVSNLISLGAMIDLERSTSYSFFFPFPMKQAEATTGDGFDDSLKGMGQEFHRSGDHSYPESDLKKFFMGGFVKSILHKFISAREAAERFPVFPGAMEGKDADTFLFNSSLGINKPRGGTNAYHHPKNWWKWYQGEMQKLGCDYLDSRMLDFGLDYDPFNENERQRNPEQWRKFFFEQLYKDISRDQDFSAWGASYLRSKVLEEKVVNLDPSFPNPRLLERFINKLSEVQDSLTRCINDFVKFSIYHKLLGLGMEKVIEDAFSEPPNRRDLIRKEVEMLQHLHEEIKEKVSQEALDATLEPRGY